MQATTIKDDRGSVHAPIHSAGLLQNAASLTVEQNETFKEGMGILSTVLYTLT